MGSITTNPSSPVSLVLDATDSPHLSYGDANRLNYAYWTGVAWDIQTVDTTGIWLSSIALDDLGYAHISYNSSDGLKYARWTGTAWDIQFVDNQGTYSSSLIH